LSAAVRGGHRSITVGKLYRKGKKDKSFLHTRKGKGKRATKLLERGVGSVPEVTCAIRGKRKKEAQPTTKKSMSWRRTARPMAQREEDEQNLRRQIVYAICCEYKGARVARRKKTAQKFS